MGELKGIYGGMIVFAVTYLVVLAALLGGLIWFVFWLLERYGIIGS